MKFDPLLYYAYRVAGQTRSVERAASDIVTVCAEEEDVRRRAFFLPDQLDRVQLAVDGVAFQTARISETPVTHQATRALLYRNAALLDGYVFAGRSRRQMIRSKPPRWPTAAPTRMDKVALVGTPVSDIFFGHYLMDDSATALLAQDFGPVRGVESANRANWEHATDYRAMMGLEVPDLNNATFSEAWLFEDVGMNSNRRARMRAVRQRLSGISPDRTGHGVFIIRSSHGQDRRILENEAEIANLLAQKGFTVINPMEEDAQTICRKISGAALVVSVEGSALTHAYLTMQDQGAIVTIQPPYRFDNVWKDFTDLLGMRYGFVVAEGSRQSFRVNPDDLMKTLDLVV